MRVLTAAALYFALTFATGWVLGPIHELWVIPHLGKTAGYLLEAPLMLVAMALAARWTLRRLAVSAALATRAAIGLVALGMVLVAETVATRPLRGLSPAEYLTGFASVPGAISLALFRVFAAMPMMVERPS